MTTTSPPPVADPVVRLDGIDAFRIREEGATILVQPSTGFVCVSSIYRHELNGVHYWPSPNRGQGSIYRFLADTYPDYCEGKFFGQQERREVDLEASKSRIRALIIEQRREVGHTTRHGFNAEKAREAWNAVGEAESADALVNEVPHIDDLWELLQYEERPVFAYWRERIWLPFITHVIAERAAGRLP